MSGIIVNAGKSAKQVAIDAAKKAVYEPAEILKAAGRQVSGMEAQPQTSQNLGTPESGATQQTQPKVDAAKLRVQGQRQLQALEAEMQQIRNMQLEQARQKSHSEEVIQPQGVQEVILQGGSRPSRRMAGKAQVKKFSGTSKAEMRKPPSG
jgi:hypothetical protein